VGEVNTFSEIRLKIENNFGNRNVLVPFFNSLLLKSSTPLY